MDGRSDDLGLAKTNLRNQKRGFQSLVLDYGVWFLGPFRS